MAIRVIMMFLVVSLMGTSVSGSEMEPIKRTGEPGYLTLREQGRLAT